MSRLPVCSAHNPTCGACGRETRFYDGLFYCEDCLLNYSEGEDWAEAEFSEPEHEPCGAACENYWHGFGKINEGQGYDCKPCPLPGPHTSDHWHPCEPTETGRTAEGRS